jgi:probable phosphoglycerate mutase
VWNDAKRIDSAAGSSLSEAGAATIHQVVEELADRQIKVIYAPQGESESQTAQIVSRCLKLRWHCRQDLRELDFGLWQGLLVEEVKQRYGKVYRQWRATPTQTCPPGGETFSDAQERIWAAVSKILKRHRDQNVMLILQPVAAALLKCRLDSADPDAIWDNIEWMGTWTSHDLDQVAFVEAKP